MPKTKESICQGCGAKLDAMSAADGSNASPQSGSLSICAYCGVLSVFEDDQSLRPITSQEFDELPKDLREEILRISHFIKQKKGNDNVC